MSSLSLSLLFFFCCYCFVVLYENNTALSVLSSLACHYLMDTCLPARAGYRFCETLYFDMNIHKDIFVPPETQNPDFVPLEAQIFFVPSETHCASGDTKNAPPITNHTQQHA